MVKTANQNTKRREKWAKENRCLACGTPKPCTNCNSKRTTSVRDKLWCDECICGGGVHRAECSTRRKT